jgi:hypothetical protein
MWLVSDLLFVVDRCCHFITLYANDLQQAGGFPNAAPPNKTIKTAHLMTQSAGGKPEAIGGFAAHGDELFVATQPTNFRGDPLQPCINVFTQDGTFLRRMAAPCAPSGLMAALSVNYGPVLVTIPSYTHDAYPWTRLPAWVWVHKLDGSALHKIHFASTPLDAATVGGRIYMTTCRADHPEPVVPNSYAYDLPAAECVNGVRIVDLEF